MFPRRVRRAVTPRAAQWRRSRFLRYARQPAAQSALPAPVRKALATIEKYRASILARWVSGHGNGRLEAFNGIFQAAKVRARGYRNEATFIRIIHLLAAPIQILVKST